MFLHGWSVRALPFRKAPLGPLLATMVLIVLAVLGAASPAHGEPGKRADKAGEVDTEHMFGFTEGSDTGEAGEKELETDSTGRFGKPGGAYNNVATALEAKYSSVSPPWRRLPITTSRGWTGLTIAAKGRCSRSRSTRDSVCSTASTRHSG
jgi:hypothetical protein